MSVDKFFANMANKVSHWAGSPLVFIAALALVLLWAASGPFFHFSDTWELVINTGTTIVTFLMVFLIQNTQNRDSAAMHAKLDELIRVGIAQNRFIGIERLTDKELDAIRASCEKRASRDDEATSERTAANRKPKSGTTQASAKLATAKTIASPRRKPAAKRSQKATESA